MALYIHEHAGSISVLEQGEERLWLFFSKHLMGNCKNQRIVVGLIGLIGFIGFIGRI